MATGILGSADLSATTNTSIYTVPASTYTIATVTVCNRNSASVAVRLSVGTATPANKDYKVYDLAVTNTFQLTGITVDAAKVIVAYSDTANVSVQVDGVEVTI